MAGGRTHKPGPVKGLVSTKELIMVTDVIALPGDMAGVVKVRDVHQLRAHKVYIILNP